MQSETDLDIKRKRTFFIYSTSFLGLLFIVLAIMNYMDGLIADVNIDFVIVALCVVSNLAVRYLNADKAIYRATYVIVCVLFLYSIAVGIGKETILYYIFAMPSMLYFYFGRREGTLWVLLFVIGIGCSIFAPSLFNRHAFDFFNISRFYITISIVILTSYGMESARHTFSKLLDRKNEVLRQENVRLERALKEIKTLSGLIPICSNCKKVRNDQGYWEQVESYIMEHSSADFSHSVCPECVEILYPEFKESLQKK